MSEARASDRRREYGSGSLIEDRGKWYGKWRIAGRQTKRVIGPIRTPGSSSGLTRTQAGRELARMMQETTYVVPAEPMTLREAGDLYLRHVFRFRERRQATVDDYRSILNRHFVPFFGKRRLDQVGRADIMRYATEKRATLKPKTIANHLTLLHGIYAHAVREGWAPANPVASVERPPAHGTNVDIRYLTPSEVSRLVAAVPSGPLASTEATIYLVAAMTGLRQGELLGLRWEDVDAQAGRVRVRRSISRGRIGPPKSNKGFRAVPMAPPVADAFARHRKASSYRAAADLVFCHPETGRAFDPSKLRKRFKEALTAAGIRKVRFHDLRHTYGTQMAAARAPLRHLQEWMGHRDYKTTAVYADYAPDQTQGAEVTARAFATLDGYQSGYRSEANSEQDERARSGQ